MYIFLGLAMGLMGSMHCIGMCGPLVMSLHTHAGITKQNILYQAAYHIGKMVAYVFIGIVFGILGQTMHLFLSQQKLSILLGIGFILFFLLNKIKLMNLSAFNSSKILPITRFFNQLVTEKSSSKMFFIGIGNGFLPCGFLYTAASASIATGYLTDSILFMVGFGLGTIPSLTAAIYIFKYLPQKTKLIFSYLYNYLTLIIGILLILRGLNLGIPYISPELNLEKEEIHGCCHKEE